jgi:hypothetical protein
VGAFSASTLSLFPLSPGSPTELNLTLVPKMRLEAGAVVEVVLAGFTGPANQPRQMRINGTNMTNETLYWSNETYPSQIAAEFVVCPLLGASFLSGVPPTPFLSSLAPTRYNPPKPLNTKPGTPNPAP